MSASRTIVSPVEHSPWVFPFDRLMEAGDTITAKEVTCSPDGIADAGEVVESGRSVRVWITFPAEAGASCWVDCKITTAQGLITARRIEFVVQPVVVPTGA